MDAQELAKITKKKNIIDMAVTFTVLMPLFQERSADLIKEKLFILLGSLDRIGSDQDFERIHEDFCLWFVKTIRLAKTMDTSSYGHAAKVLDSALKVYVYYCKMPSPSKVEFLMPRLNGVIDTPILRYLFKKLEEIYTESIPPHYLWTIKMIGREDYDLLQKVIRQDIKDSFHNDILSVQYDDIIKLKLVQCDVETI